MSTKKKLNQLKHMSFKGDRILWAGLIFFSIPVIILVIIILLSSLGTGQVIEGNRFDHDLDPEITTNLIKETKTALEANTGYESVEVNLKAATVLVTLKVADTNLAPEFSALALEAVNLITETLPLDPYFTKTDTMKMYDLQLDVYNHDPSDPTKVLYHTILIKNANMLEWTIQDVSTALNPDLAADLRAKLAAKEAEANGPLPSGSETDTSTETPTN